MIINILGIRAEITVGHPRKKYMREYHRRTRDNINSRNRAKYKARTTA